MNSYVNRYVYISYHRGENDKNLSAHSNLSNNHSPLKQDRTAALRWHHSDVKLSFLHQFCWWAHAARVHPASTNVQDEQSKNKQKKKSQVPTFWFTWRMLLQLTIHDWYMTIVANSSSGSCGMKLRHMTAKQIFICARIEFNQSNAMMFDNDSQQNVSPRD